MSDPRIPRRVALHLGISALAAPARSVAAPIASFPQDGDLLVFEGGDRIGAIIEPSELIEGEPPVLARAMEPTNRFIRNQLRFGLILLVRLKAETLTDAESPLATDGIVAFSAICTHAGCTVSGWKPKEEHFLCPCHLSVYDPASGGLVVAGPAPRPLPSLPLRIDGLVLTVAAQFTARIGGSTGRTD